MKLDGQRGTMRCDGAGRILSMSIGGMMELRLEPEELAKQSEYSGDLFWKGAIEVDRPLGDPRQVRALVLEVAGDDGNRLVSGPGQQVERAEKTILRLGAAAPAVRAEPEEVEKYLRAEVDFPIEDEVVVALARKAVGDAKEPREKVRRLVSFVSEYVVDSLGRDSGNVRKIIDQRAGDCTEHALLFTCLARAVGIPARPAGGLMYMGDEFRTLGPHAWNEVILDGVWVPIDPTWNEFPADAARIRFGADGNDGLVLLATLGKLRLEVKEIERREQ
jgi:transglutaminase-like putative cysteine protease